jgi:hypothetical protein
VLGIGISDAVTGTDADGAAKAKVVILPEGGTFSQPYGVTISGTPIYVTTNNPNGMPLSVYSNGILFRDTYFAYDNQSYNTEIGTAFYTIATTVELKAINVPNGYAATFSTESNGASINGNILTVGTDVTEVSVSAQRAASGWLAEGVRAASFSTTGTNNITIMSAAELGLLAYNVNFGGETYEDYTITLGDNIDLNNNTWEPIGYGLSSGMGGGMVSPSIGGGMVIGGGDSASGFLGTFDGAGHTIINMSVEGSMNVGLFSTVDEGVTVKDLFISRAVVKGNMYVGTVAGSVSGTIQNCHVLSSSIEVEASDEMPSGMGGGYGSPIMLGGIAGMSQYGTINGCTIMESSIYPQPASSMGVGGIVGYATNAILTDNLSAADIAKKSSDNYFGAIVGMDMGSTISNNYYVDGLGIYNTPNTELKAVNGTDTEGEAQRAYVYSSKPEGFGDAVTEYGYGMEAYSTGLHYNLEWYSPTEPTSMDITLSSTEDNSTLLSTYSGITGKVTLDRTFTKNGSWYTICLPFDIDINDEDKPSPLDGAELWQMADYDEENPTGFDEESGTLTLNFENCVDDDGISTISAGRPYLIKWNNTGETISNPVFENVTISVTSPEDNNIFGNNGEITFIGTFSPLNITGADNTKLYLGAGNLLYYPYADMTIGALRAYFQLNGITAGNPTDPNATGVRAFVLNFGDGEQTGISDMEANSSLFTPHSSLKDEWFDLSGRRLNGKPTQRGMYISNGRKVVIK